MVTEQLERSLLERKERDELHAIASALSLKASTRLKKADIIDLILQATTGSSNGTPNKETGAVTTGVQSDTASRQSSFNAQLSLGEELPISSSPENNGSQNGRQISDASLESAAPAPKKRTKKAKSPATDVANNDRETAGKTDEADSTTETQSAGDVQSQDTVVGNNSGGDKGNAVSPTIARAPARTSPGRNTGGENQEVSPTAGELVKKEDTSPPATSADANGRKSRRRRGRDRERSDTAPSNSEAPWQGELVMVRGLLDLKEDGYGFLRTTSYLASSKDVYVSVSQVRRFGLRKGDAIEGACRPAASNEKYPALIRIDTIGTIPAEEIRNRPKFEDLTPLFPDEPLHLELPNEHSDMTSRIIDLISPIGKGQRGMIVSPPKAGKTTIMKQIARSIEANNPDVHLIVLLVDERPEEVTDMRRSVRGEVVASTFDRPSDEHAQVAELTIERAKRLVELGKDVVIILDGITRLARAYNLSMPATGRIMSGGVDSGALYPPKRFFGAARNVEEGGSLTILATALVETGSKMDEVIFEEFKGTGNMELRLDRRLAERRLYPAIDVNASSTRHEELLFDRNQLQQVWKLRRVLNAIGGESNSAAGLELLLDKLKSTRSNDEFLAEIAKSPTPS